MVLQRVGSVRERIASRNERGEYMGVEGGQGQNGSVSFRHMRQCSHPEEQALCSQCLSRVVSLLGNGSCRVWIWIVPFTELGICQYTERDGSCRCACVHTRFMQQAPSICNYIYGVCMCSKQWTSSRSLKRFSTVKFLSHCSVNTKERIKLYFWDYPSPKGYQQIGVSEQIICFQGQKL